MCFSVKHALNTCLMFVLLVFTSIATSNTVEICEKLRNDDLEGVSFIALADSDLIDINNDYIPEMVSCKSAAATDACQFTDITTDMKFGYVVFGDPGINAWTYMDVIEFKGKHYILVSVGNVGEKAIDSIIAFNGFNEETLCYFEGHWDRKITWNRKYNGLEKYFKGDIPKDEMPLSPALKIKKFNKKTDIIVKQGDQYSIAKRYDLVDFDNSGSDEYMAVMVDSDEVDAYCVNTYLVPVDDWGRHPVMFDDTGRLAKDHTGEMCWNKTEYFTFHRHGHDQFFIKNDNEIFTALLQTLVSVAKRDDKYVVDKMVYGDRRTSSEDALRPLPEAREWSLETANDSLIKYVTHGWQVNGHEFGFVKKAGQCDKDVMWLTWSTYDKSIQKYEGKDVILNFKVAGESLNLPISYLTTGEIGGMYIVTLTDFVPNERFMTLLESDYKIKVRIVSPDEFAEKFDIVDETFDLSRIKHTRDKAENSCKSISSAKH